MSATCNPCPCPVSPSDVEDLEKQLPGYLKATVEWFRLYKVIHNSCLYYCNIKCHTLYVQWGRSMVVALYVSSAIV